MNPVAIGEKDIEFYQENGYLQVPHFFSGVDGEAIGPC